MLPVILAFGSLFFLAFYSILIEAKVAHINPVAASFVAYLGGSLASGALLLLNKYVISLPLLRDNTYPNGSSEIVTLLGIGFCLLIADMLYLSAYHFGGTFKEIFVISALCLPAMVPWALLILGEPFDIRYIPGYLLVGSGVYWIITIFQQQQISR